MDFFSCYITISTPGDPWPTFYSFDLKNKTRKRRGEERGGDGRGDERRQQERRGFGNREKSPVAGDLPIKRQRSLISELCCDA